MNNPIAALERADDDTKERILLWLCLIIPEIGDQVNPNYDPIAAKEIHLSDRNTFDTLLSLDDDMYRVASDRRMLS